MELTSKQVLESSIDPVKYCKYFLQEGITIEAAMDPNIPINYANAPVLQQRIIMRSVARYQRTSVAGANAWGKSHMLARLASWWIDKHSECLVVVTAPKFSQIEMNFSMPFRRLRGALEIPTGKATMRAYLPDPSNPYRQIFATTANAPENFAGWHGFKNKLFLFDEASGIRKDIWDAVRPMYGRPDSKILVVGNPIREEDEENHVRFKETSENPNWNFFMLNGWLHPNVIHGRRVIEGGNAPEWPQQMLDELGPDDPQYIARVLGQFSTSLSESMYALWLDRLTVRDGNFEDYRRGVLGIDMAGENSGDKTVITRWGWDNKGHNVEVIYSNEIATPENVADFVQKQFREKKAAAVGCDTNGLGYAMPALLASRGIKKERIYRYIGHERAVNQRRYESKYDEDAFTLRAMMADSILASEGTSQFRIRYNPHLHNQLDSRKFTTRKGRLVLTDKNLPTKSSPDEFDALLIGMDAYRKYRNTLRLIPSNDGTGYIPLDSGGFSPIDEMS